MAESDDGQVQQTSLVGLVRHHVTLVLTLIPILLSGMRIFAEANGDRPTLVTLPSTLDVKAVLLGTFAWLLPLRLGWRRRFVGFDGSSCDRYRVRGAG